MQLVCIRDIRPGDEVRFNFVPRPGYLTHQSQIVVSYVDTTLPCDQRRMQLKDTYGFDCTCTLCQRSENQPYVDPRAAIYCPTRCGGVSFLPTLGIFAVRSDQRIFYCDTQYDAERPYVECTTCKKRAPAEAEAVQDALRIGQEALDKVTELQDSGTALGSWELQGTLGGLIFGDLDPIRAAKIAKNISSLLTSAGITDGSHPLLGLLRSHHYLLTTSLSLSADALAQTAPTASATEEHQQLLDDAIRTAARVLQGLVEVLPVGHPIRAIHLSELGLLCATDETASNIPSLSLPTNEKVFPPAGAARLQLAINYLIEARKELLIGFGTRNEGGDVGKKVRETLVQLETEMAIWKQGVKTAWKEQVVDGPKR